MRPGRPERAASSQVGAAWQSPCPGAGLLRAVRGPGCGARSGAADPGLRRSLQPGAPGRPRSGCRGALLRGFARAPRSPKRRISPAPRPRPRVPLRGGRGGRGPAPGAGARGRASGRRLEAPGRRPGLCGARRGCARRPCPPEEAERCVCGRRARCGAADGACGSVSALALPSGAKRARRAPPASASHLSQRISSTGRLRARGCGGRDSSRAASVPGGTGRAGGVRAAASGNVEWRGPHRLACERMGRALPAAHSLGETPPAPAQHPRQVQLCFLLGNTGAFSRLQGPAALAGVAVMGSSRSFSVRPLQPSPRGQLTLCLEMEVRSHEGALGGASEE